MIVLYRHQTISVIEVDLAILAAEQRERAIKNETFIFLVFITNAANTRIKIKSIFNWINDACIENTLID